MRICTIDDNVSTRKIIEIYFQDLQRSRSDIEYETMDFPYNFDSLFEYDMIFCDMNNERGLTQGPDIAKTLHDRSYQGRLIGMSHGIEIIERERWAEFGYEYMQKSYFLGNPNKVNAIINGERIPMTERIIEPVITSAAPAENPAESDIETGNAPNKRGCLLALMSLIYSRK
ncbi:MAG: hypothetical protein J4473_01030 [Candidatus Aenigmarchaeota archaeon]|nr:hypothetical protein [Candidatus Aenigmarchaeota archaeon]